MTYKIPLLERTIHLYEYAVEVLSEGKPPKAYCPNCLKHFPFPDGLILIVSLKDGNLNRIYSKQIVTCTGCETDLKVEATKLKGLEEKDAKLKGLEGKDGELHHILYNTCKRKIGEYEIPLTKKRLPIILNKPIKIRLKTT